MKGYPITPDEHQEIKRMRAEGKTYREIAEWVGCSISAVHYHCVPGRAERVRQTERIRYERKRAATRDKRDRITEQHVAMMLALYAGGCSFGAVSRAIGCDRSTVRRYVNAALSRAEGAA